MSGCCPNCGYDLVQDEPIERAGIRMEPYQHPVVRGRRLVLTPAQRTVLWTLLKANGRIIPSSVLNERLDYDGDNNVVQVLISRIRRVWPGPCPIETVYGSGYRIA